MKNDWWNVKFIVYSNYFNSIHQYFWRGTNPEKVRLKFIKEIIHDDKNLRILEIKYSRNGKLVANRI